MVSDCLLFLPSVVVLLQKNHFDMNSLAGRSLQHVQLGLRGLKSTPQSFATSNVSPQFKKLKIIQEIYQIPDGKPVHLKAGKRDTLMYHTTILLCAVGLGMTFKFIYEQAVPRKN